MITAAILLTGLLLQTPQDTVTYQNLSLNLAFDHPKTWKVTSDKKQGSMKAEISVGDQGEKAVLEVFPIVFGAEPELWQQLQAQISKQMSREVTRQWQEEIVGVPILLTQTHYYDRGVESRQLTGLIYSRWVKKLLFHLTAPTSAYSSAEVDWRTVLLSLRTLDGSQIRPETPNRPLSSDEMKPNLNPGITKVTSLPPKERGGRVRKAKQVENLTVGGKPAELRYPDGWTLTKTANGYDLKHPDVLGVVQITVNSTLDSDPPDAALLKASGTSLALFRTVAQRDEITNVPTSSGSALSRVTRDGVGQQDAPLWTIDATGLLGDNYWQLVYRSGSALTKKEQKLVLALTEQLSVDLAPQPQAAPEKPATPR